MISLHQLFRVLSRVSVDPTGPFYAANVQSPVSGPPGGPPSRGPKGVSASCPAKSMRGSQPAEGGLLSACTTASHAQAGPRAAGPEPQETEDSLTADGGSSSFGFSSNASATETLDFEGPSLSASSPAGDQRGPKGGPPPQERPSVLCSTGSSPLSSCATSPLLAAPPADSASVFSLSGGSWGPGPLLTDGAAEGPLAGGPLLAAGLQQGWPQEKPSSTPSRAGLSAAAAACQQEHEQQQRRRRLLTALGDAAAAAAALQELQEETNSAGPSVGGPSRAGSRRKRRQWRQQTPWDKSCSSNRYTAKTAADVLPPLQQQIPEERSLTRQCFALSTSTAAGAAAPAAAGFALGGAEAGAESRRSSKRRSRALKGHQQQQQQQQHVEEGASSSFAASNSSFSCVSLSSKRGGAEGPPLRAGSGMMGGGGSPHVCGGDSRLLGVCFSPPKDVWRARITVDGRQFEHQFSVKRHGFDGARLLATRWRAEMENAAAACLRAVTGLEREGAPRGPPNKPVPAAPYRHRDFPI
ncbi:hypothetical protein Efla_002337 [Eimeria flavescens]